jgi:NAD(P)-dependent dehydrogenase (short-subunit alcohol dehydrogenase family)
VTRNDLAAGASAGQGKTVIVTGAGTNLGQAMALRLLSDGFNCVLGGLVADELQETVELSGEHRVQATALACDVRLPEDRQRLIELAVEQPGKLFGLVNNAGVFRFRPFFDETLTDWRDTLEINLEAPFFLAQLAIEAMRKNGEGRIVNIASMHGVVGVNNLGRGATMPETTPEDRGPVRCSAYATSKGGLIQLTRELAIAAGRWGITVNAVSPGTVRHKKRHANPATDATDASRMPAPSEQAINEAMNTIAQQTLLGRLGKAEDIAGPVRFLLSDDAAYITGANLVVDGGFTAW